MTFTTEEQITYVPVDTPADSITIGDRTYDQCLFDDQFYISRTEPFTFLNANGNEIVETTITQHRKLGDTKYKQVSNNYKDEHGKWKTHHALVHVLIADQYLDNPDPETLVEIDHRNRDGTDNRISNLRRVSKRLNMLNRIKDERQYFINELPADAISVPKYGNHVLDNDEAQFWFSKQEQMLYVQVDTDRYRNFVLDSRNSFHPTDVEGKFCNIPLSKLNDMRA